MAGETNPRRREKRKHKKQNQNKKENTPMNFELPPLRFKTLDVLPRKAEKGRPPKTIDKVERIAASQRARALFAEVAACVRSLTPEEKRAVFLKMTHDRPLTKADLAGSDLRFFNTPGEKESLLIPITPEALEFKAVTSRLANLETDSETKKSLALALNMTDLSVASPEERLCDAFRKKYKDFVAKKWFVYEIEISSFATQPATKQEELRETLEKLRHFLTSGTVYEHDDAQMNEGVIRAVVSSNGTQFKQLVENLEWQHLVTCFDERPKFETFQSRYNDFNIADTTLVPPPKDAPRICVIDSGVAAGNPFLEPVVDRELSKSFIEGFEPLEDAIGHGSGFASLAAYHFIDITKDGKNEALAKIVSARITNDKGQLDAPEEQDDEFRLFRGDETLQDIRAKIAEVDMQEEVTEATEEEADDLKFNMGIQLRSFGTLQSDVFEWTTHAAEYSRQPYTLTVSLSAVEWNTDGKKDPVIPLAVVVRIEDTSGRCDTLYSEVKAYVEARTQARIRA
jgi:hypothetical protein